MPALLNDDLTQNVFLSLGDVSINSERILYIERDGEDRIVVFDNGVKLEVSGQGVGWLDHYIDSVKKTSYLPDL